MKTNYMTTFGDFMYQIDHKRVFQRVPAITRCRAFPQKIKMSDETVFFIKVKPIVEYVVRVFFLENMFS